MWKLVAAWLLATNPWNNSPPNLMVGQVDAGNNVPVAVDQYGRLILSSQIGNGDGGNSGGTLPVYVENGQDAGSSCMTLCQGYGTQIGCISGYSSAQFCNNGSNPIWYGQTPALSGQFAIDAGTNVGTMLPSNQCVQWGAGTKVWCVATPGQEQNSPDAGTPSNGIR
jgi:hypothetical protein